METNKSNKRKTGSLRYIQDNFRVKTIEEISEHLEIPVRNLRNYYHRYFYYKNVHTIVKDVKTERYIVDSREFKEGKLEVLPLGKRFRIPPSFEKYEEDNLVRWKSPVIDSIQWRNRKRMEREYKIILKGLKGKLWGDCYYVRAKNILYSNIKQSELAIKLDLSISAITYRIKLGLIERITTSERLKEIKEEIKLKKLSK